MIYIIKTTQTLVDSRILIGAGSKKTSDENLISDPSTLRVKQTENCAVFFLYFRYNPTHTILSTDLLLFPILPPPEKPALT